MTTTLKSILTWGIAISIVILPCQSVKGEIATAATIATIFSGLEKLIKQIEESGHSLLQAGNSYAGQQQLLLAGTLRSTLEQFKNAYNDSLNQSFSKIDAQRQASLRDLNSLVDKAGEIASKSIADAQNLVYATAGQANAIMGRIPGLKRTPVYFGLNTRDLLSAAGATPIDLELLGFYLADPALVGYAPEIKVEDEVIPPSNISAQFDRIKIVLPEVLKKKLSVGAGQCEPIKSFSLELTIYWSNWPTLAKWSSYFANKTSFKDFSKVGKQLYDITIRVDGKAMSTSITPGSFRVSSGQQNWTCEQRLSVGPVAFTAPEPDALILNATGSWEGMGGRWEDKNVGAVAINGATASVVGTVRGGNKEFGNCPGAGHGEVVLAGNYQYPKSVSEDFTFVNTALLNKNAQVTLPVNESKVPSKIWIEIRRRGCSAVVDSTEMALTGEVTAPGDQTSKNGFFKAHYEKGQLDIIGSSLLP